MNWILGFRHGSVTNRPSLVISTLEALAALISLKLFFGDEPKQERTKVQVVPTWTHNRGNGSALNKLMSTKFTSSAVVMELSCYLKRMSANGLRVLQIAKPTHWRMERPMASTLTEN